MVAENDTYIADGSRGSIKKIRKNGNGSFDHLGGQMVLKFFVVAQSTVENLQLGDGSGNYDLCNR